MAGRHRLSNAALEDIMADIRMTEGLGESKQLPKEVNTLHNELNDIELTYCQRCSQCKQYKMWTYSRDSSNEVNKDRQCCKKPLLNTQDHFVFLNPAQVLRLAIPVNLRSRRLDLISPEEKQQFQELELNCEQDFSLTLNYDGVSVF